MTTNILNKQAADYDVVGNYQQDKINGFKPNLIEKMILSAGLKDNFVILDAMAGNGNLTSKILNKCKENQIINIKITTLEFSEDQCEIAKKNLTDENINIFWGDILTLKSFATDENLPLQKFDRILLKNANHEIPLNKQNKFYENLFSLLKPGGKLIMLGFIFENEIERNEFTTLTKFKDSMAGMFYAVENHHFSTRKEINILLEEVGFINQITAECFDYTIHSEVAVEEYFKKYDKDYASGALQSEQAKALTLRRNGRIRFYGDQSIMLMPGEIIIAEKPSFDFQNISTFKKFSVDLLGNVKIHMEMLSCAAKYIENNQKVLDIGCGSGLLTSLITDKNISYTGLDISTEFINICKMKFAWFKNFSFAVHDIHHYDITPNKYDVVSIMNTLYLPGMKPVDILRNVHQNLKPKGKVIVSGPTSINSLRVAQEKIFLQLINDGFSEQESDIIPILRFATENLMTKHANYYSAEGMVELLLQLGFKYITEVNTSIYYNNGYLIVAEK